MFPHPSDAERVFDGSRRMLDDEVCRTTTVEPSAAGAVPFAVEVVGRPTSGATDPNCHQLALQVTATDQPAGYPHRTTTQLLRYGNTLSWQVQQSPDDTFLVEGSPVSVGDGEPPSLAGLCQQLRAMGTSG